jgi:transcriptional regulator with XRE-family HTH domain
VTKSVIFNCTPALKRRRLVLGAVVRRERTAIDGLSQETLAYRICRNRHTISRMEQGHFSPRLDDCWLLADGLGVNLSDMIREVEDTIAATPAVFTPAPPPRVGTDVYKNQCRSGIMAPLPGTNNWDGELIAHYCDDDSDPKAVAHGCGCGHVWDNQFAAPGGTA